MEKQKMNRREFLKLLMMLPLAGKAFPTRITPNSLLYPASQPDRPNILFFLFDTLSARNISLYGYPRATMPNLASFAEQAVVFHQHHSAGSWTPSGTASLLTGTYPWTHRSISIYSEVLEPLEDKNIFSIFNSTYNTRAYTQNPLVHTLLHQFSDQIDDLINLEEGGVYNLRPEGNAFNNDFRSGFWGQNVVQGTWEMPASSPFLAVLNELRYSLKYRRMYKNLASEYPYWISTILPGMYVFLDEAIEWLQEKLQDTPLPSLSYYHFFPPHHPYSPRVEFSRLFNDNWSPPQKPLHAFHTQTSQEYFDTQRLKYDQFIANCDDEFGNVINTLEDLGLLENSYIVFTSDHGESLERGVWGHVNPLLYEPLTHIPLLIHKPGQTSREDVYSPTSSTDVLPTLMRISNQEIPEWVEGEILPGFRSEPVDPQRSIFSVEAKENNKFGPLTIATIAMIKWPFKLIHYLGYEELPNHFELYNLEEDPEEMADLYPSSPSYASDLEIELLERIEKANQSMGEI